MKYSTEIVWVLLAVLTSILSKLNQSPAHAFDKILMSPLFVIVGLVLSYWLFSKQAGALQSWWPLARFTIFNLLGVLLVLGISSGAFAHVGPGALGVIIFYLLYIAVAIVVIAVMTLKLAVDVSKATSAIEAYSFARRAVMIGTGVFLVITIAGLAYKWMMAQPIGENKAEYQVSQWQRDHDRSNLKLQIGHSSNHVLMLIYTDYKTIFGMVPQPDGPVPQASLDFLNDLLSRKWFLEIMQLPGNDWKAALNVRGDAILTSEIEISAIKNSDWEELTENLADFSNQKVSWIWIRAAADAKEGFVEKCKSIALRFLKDPDAKKAMGENPKASPQLEKAVDETIAAIESGQLEYFAADRKGELKDARYDTFVRPSFDLMKIAYNFAESK